MSFCCGASMIGTKGTLKHLYIQIHNVPLILCPVCHRVEIHYLIEHEYRILIDYAHEDQVEEIDFNDYADGKSDGNLYENCVNHESQNPNEVLLSQIDMALDLLNVATVVNDTAWQIQLKSRLAVLSEKRDHLKKRKALR